MTEKLNHGFKQIGRFLGSNASAYPYFVHLLVAFTFFFPFFARGYPYIASIDLVTITGPMYISLKREFLNWQFNFWNPDLLGGVPAAMYANAPLYDLTNWPIFLLAEEDIFLGLTLTTFIKFCLIGCLSYRVFLIEFADRKLSLALSLVYQLCGYTLWNAQLLDLFSLWCFTTLAVYLLWSLERRTKFTNFLFLTITLFEILLPSHLVTGVYTMVFLFGLTLIRMHRTSAGFADFAAVSSAFGIVTLAGFIRIVPTLIEIQDSSRMVDLQESTLVDFIDHSYFLIRNFIPEGLGVNFATSQQVIGRLGEHMGNMHIHYSAPHFFGSVAGVLFLVGIFNLPRRGGVWFVFAAVVFGAIILLKPFTVLHKLLLPPHHILGLQIFFPLPFVMAIGHFMASGRVSRTTLATTSLAVSTVVLFGLTVWLYAFKELYRVYQVLVAALVALAVALYFLRRHSPRACAVALRVLAGLFAGAVLTYCFYNIFVRGGNQSPTFHAHLRLLSLSLAALVIWMSLYSFESLRSKLLERSLSLAAIGGAGLVFGLFYLGQDFAPTLELPDLTQARETAMLGILRFGIVALFLGALFFFTKFDRAHLPVLLAVLTLIELVPGNQVYNFITQNPFYKEGRTAYPERDFSEIDSVNFRVNHPHVCLQLPIVNRIWGPDREIISSIFPVYGLRSYGGYFNAMKQRQDRFLRSFIPANEIQENGNYAHSSDGRLLDLLAVKYDFDLPGCELRRRPTALSRFAFFTGYEILNDEKRILARLREPDFRTGRVVLLEQEPGLPANRPTAFRMLPGRELSKDRIVLEGPFETDGLVLFDDFHHPGWQAKTDGRPAAVLRANYGFMAIKVPRDTSAVEFSFEPMYRNHLWDFARIVLLLFLLLLSGWGLYSFKKEKFERPRLSFDRSVASFAIGLAGAVLLALLHFI